MLCSGLIVFLVCYLRVCLPIPHIDLGVEYSLLYDIIVKYARVVDILVALNPSETALHKATIMYDEVFLNLQEYHSFPATDGRATAKKKAMSINFHAHLHLTQVLLEHGSIRTVWCFYFER